MDGNKHLLLVPFIELLHQEVQVGGEHIRLLDGMHSALGYVLGTLLVLALVGEHILD